MGASRTNNKKKGSRVKGSSAERSREKGSSAERSREKGSSAERSREKGSKKVKKAFSKYLKKERLQGGAALSGDVGNEITKRFIDFNFACSANDDACINNVVNVLSKLQIPAKYICKSLKTIKMDRNNPRKVEMVDKILSKLASEKNIKCDAPENSYEYTMSDSPLYLDKVIQYLMIWNEHTDIQVDEFVSNIVRFITDWRADLIQKSPQKAAEIYNDFSVKLESFLDNVISQPYEKGRYINIETAKKLKSAITPSNLSGGMLDEALTGNAITGGVPIPLNGGW